MQLDALLNDNLLLTNRKIMRYLGAAALIAVFLVACGDSDPIVGDNNSNQQTEEGDRAQLAEMRRAINALIGDAAGASIEDCRYSGLGTKPCGGPWEYVIYSTSSTDSLALTERLIAYNAFEAEMNERYEYASDCSVPEVPVLAYREGRCIAE